MDLAFTLWMLLLVALWLKAAAIRSVPLTSSRLSMFEIERRAQSGDVAARFDLEREAVLPRLRALRTIFVFTLIVVASALAIYVLGWVIGVIVAVVVGLHIDKLATLRGIARLSAKYYLQYETAIIQRVSGWRWLDWFKGESGVADGRIYSKAELTHLLDRSPGILTAQERTSMTGLLTMADKIVSDIMTPRTMIEAIAVEEGVGPLVIDQLHRTGHSRFPVYDKDIDHVVGMLYLHDLVELKSAHATVREAMQPRVYYIHESQSLEHALHGFLRSHHHLFIVVNDYRETVGVLSLEDVIEAMLGRTIVDEFDEFDDLRKVAAHNPKKNNQPKGRKEV